MVGAPQYLLFHSSRGSSKHYPPGPSAFKMQYCWDKMEEEEREREPYRGHRRRLQSCFISFTVLPRDTHKR